METSKQSQRHRARPIPLLTDQRDPDEFSDVGFLESRRNVAFEEIRTPRGGVQDEAGGVFGRGGFPELESPKLVPKSYWVGWRGDVTRDDFEEYRTVVEQEIERLRVRCIELEVWKREKLRSDAEEAHGRQIEMEKPKAESPSPWVRGGPNMPVPPSDLYDGGASQPGHFIFNNILDRLKELNIKALCIRAKLALVTEQNKKARQLAEEACQLARDFDFEPILSKAQFWRGAAAYQASDWAMAVEALEMGQRARGVYAEGEIAARFLEKAKAFLDAEEREKGAGSAAAAAAVVVEACEEKALRPPNNSPVTAAVDRIETEAPMLAGGASALLSLAGQLDAVGVTRSDDSDSSC